MHTAMHSVVSSMPPKLVHWLGAEPVSPDLAAWETYVKSLRISLQASWDRAKNSYLTLKQVRANLGLPFIVDGTPPEGGAAPGMSPNSAWQSDLDQQAVNVMGMVTLATGALDDVVRPEGDPRKRKLVWDATRGDFGIEAMPGDLLRLEIQQGAPTLVSASTGQRTDITGTISAIPLLIVGAAVVVTVVQTIGVVLIVKQACETLRTITEEKTARTVAEKQFECVQSGKCTPEEAAKLGTSIVTASTELTKEKTELEKAKKPPSPTDWAKLVQAVGFVAVAVGAIYLLARVVPQRAAAPALAEPLLENLTAAQDKVVGAALGARYAGSGAFRTAGGVIYSYDLPIADVTPTADRLPALLLDRSASPSRTTSKHISFVQQGLMERGVDYRVVSRVRS